MVGAGDLVESFAVGVFGGVAEASFAGLGPGWETRILVLFFKTPFLVSCQKDERTPILRCMTDFRTGPGLDDETQPPDDLALRCRLTSFGWP